MSMVAGSIKEIVSIKIKPRHDGITDQFNRIFMTKMCIICSAIIGVNYFNDNVDCIVANSNGMQPTFVGTTCWIQGFYIFKEMEERLNKSGYYGIPKNMDYDGINSLNELCAVKDRADEHVKDCKPMEKVFYLQYQYMPFFTAALSILFYIPYVVFKVTNTDLVSLKDTLKREDLKTDELMSSYFSSRINNKRTMRYRVGMNILVKILYVAANIAAFIICDRLLNHNFRMYGIEFAKWTGLENFKANDHNLKVRVQPKPGNVLLPPMGFCEIHEASRDVRNTHINSHKFICEISPHILYQYVMLVFWFLVVAGILLSAAGLLSALFGQLFTMLCFMNARDPARKMYKLLTMREIDYLEYIRRKDMPRYSEILRRLRDDRYTRKDEEDSFEMKKPLYPSL